MTSSVKMIKSLNALGSAVAIIALFIEAYSHSIITADGTIHARWSYSFMFGWMTSSNPAVANLFPPNQLGFPFALNLFFITTSLASIYVNLSKPLEEQPNLEALKPHAVILFLVPLLAVIYLIIFPCMFLFPNNYYFPFIQVQDHYSSLIRLHSISAGYIFLMATFVLTLPYSIFYYQAIMKFETASKKDRRDQLLAQYQDEINLDEIIAKETIKMKHLRRN